MDKKPTNSEIVKALKCCISSLCAECPFKAMNCDEKVPMAYALDLINRLQAENERVYADIMTYKLRWARATAKLNTAKSEAYKECIEKVKEELLFIRRECRNMLDNDGVVAIENAMKKIDNLLKEMVGEDNA